AAVGRGRPASPSDEAGGDRHQARAGAEIRAGTKTDGTTQTAPTVGRRRSAPLSGKASSGAHVTGAEWTRGGLTPPARRGERRGERPARQERAASTSARPNAKHQRGGALARRRPVRRAAGRTGAV